MEIQQDKIITLTLPLSQVGIILQALGEIPAKFSIQTIEVVQAQVGQQMAPPPTE